MFFKQSRYAQVARQNSHASFAVNFKIDEVVLWQLRSYLNHSNIFQSKLWWAIEYDRVWIPIYSHDVNYGTMAPLDFPSMASPRTRIDGRAVPLPAPCRTSLVTTRLQQPRPQVMVRTGFHKPSTKSFLGLYASDLLRLFYLGIDTFACIFSFWGTRFLYLWLQC